MTGRQFEQYLEALFTKLGYLVERTPYVGDYGADLVVWKAGVKTVIQAKRHKSRVGAKAIGEVLRAKGNYGCSSAMIVTNNFFTRQAKEEAQNNGIELWDRDELIRQLLSVKEPNHAAIASGPPSPQTVSHALSPRPREVNTPDALSSPEDQPEAAALGVTAGTCLVCGKTVSEKVKQY